MFLFFHIPAVLTACYLTSYIITSSFPYTNWCLARQESQFSFQTPHQSSLSNNWSQHRTEQEKTSKEKTASTHAPISCSVWDHRFNWNCLQESTCKSSLFTHKYTLKLYDCCEELVRVTQFSSYWESLLSLFHCTITFFAQNKWGCPNHLPGLCIKGWKTATLSEASEAQLQQIETTGPVRTESISPEKYFNSWGFTVPFLSSAICSTTNYETDSSGDCLKSPRNPDTCSTDVISWLWKCVGKPTWKFTLQCLVDTWRYLLLPGWGLSHHCLVL